MVVGIFLFAAFRNGTFKRFSCDSDENSLEQRWDKKFEDCQKTCRIIDECNMYLSDEEDVKLDQERCTDLCMRQPDSKWTSCTLKVESEHGCDQKTAFRTCSEHLPSVPKEGT
ncbi:MAG: hypothetical protein CMI52_01560 [Parcubacteria group bacterium]|nr:hypothetical protein [Parcubacteria group bacterium]